MARQINSEGEKFIQQWEGLKLSAYLDSVGVPTIGYGHTKGVKLGQTITKTQAEGFLRADLKWAQQAVEWSVKVPLSDNQFAALVSFVFNVGPTAFAKSTLRRKLNAGDYASVPKELRKWNKGTVNGKKVELKGLTNRRVAEGYLWVKGDFVSSRDVKAQAPQSSAAKITKVAATVITGGTSASEVGLEPIQQAANALVSQQSELTSGSAIRIIIAVGIVALTVFLAIRSMKD